MSRGQQLLRLFFLLLAGALIVAVVVFWWGITSPKQLVDGQKQDFAVEKGESFLQISQKLEQQGLIKSRIFFQAYGLLTGQYKKLQPGRYALSTSLNIIQITGKLARGEYVPERLTIIEGWDLRDIYQQLETQRLEAVKDFWEVVGQLATSSNSLQPAPDFWADFAFLQDKPPALNLEGYLFPDTYELKTQDTAQTIVKKALLNFNQKFSIELRQKVQAQKRSIFDIVRMASLLEKEVKTYPDKQIVAGLLWKRLQEGWPLQVDATLGYLTSKTSLQLTMADLNLDSSYNTYKYKGLPLGPICNPGLESLKAAIDYQASDYWFYLSKPDGATVFSKTLAEHEANREKYLK